MRRKSQCSTTSMPPVSLRCSSTGSPQNKMRAGRGTGSEILPAYFVLLHEQQVRALRRNPLEQTCPPAAVAGRPRFSPTTRSSRSAKSPRCGWFARLQLRPAGSDIAPTTVNPDVAMSKPRVGQVVPHPELLASAHPFGPQLGILRPRIASQQPRVVVGKPARLRTLNRSNTVTSVSSRQYRHPRESW